MASDLSERVEKSRRKAVAAGRKRLTGVLSKEGSERFFRLRANHRSDTALIEAALAALESGAVDEATVLRSVADQIERLSRIRKAQT